MIVMMERIAELDDEDAFAILDSVCSIARPAARPSLYRLLPDDGRPPAPPRVLGGALSPERAVEVTWGEFGGELLECTWREVRGGDEYLYIRLRRSAGGGGA